MKKIFSVVLLIGLIQVNAIGDSSLKILAIGDSTTAGTPGFLSSAEAPPNGRGDVESQYAFWMMKLHPTWDVANRGVNGQRSDEILGRLEEEIESFGPEMVIVLAGVNDLYQGTSAESVKGNLKEMYQISKERNLKVVACTILPYDSAGKTVRERMTDVNQWIKDYSKEQGFVFCDTFKVLEDPSKPFHLKESPDGLHPSVNGYRQMGETIAGEIAAAVQD